MEPKDIIINSLLQQIGGLSVQIAQERAQAAVTAQTMQQQIGALQTKVASLAPAEEPQPEAEPA